MGDGVEFLVSTGRLPRLWLIGDVLFRRELRCPPDRWGRAAVLWGEKYVLGADRSPGSARPHVPHSSRLHGGTDGPTPPLRIPGWSPPRPCLPSWPRSPGGCGRRRPAPDRDGAEVDRRHRAKQLALARRAARRERRRLAGSALVAQQSGVVREPSRSERQTDRCRQVGQVEQCPSWPVDDKTQQARSRRRCSPHSTGDDRGEHLPARRQP